MKYAAPLQVQVAAGRSPCGERGLKSRFGQDAFCHRASLPVRGAWIEMPTVIVVLSASMSLPVRGAWIEICRYRVKAVNNGSLPVRGAWIEIHMSFAICIVPLSLPVRGAWIEIVLFAYLNKERERRSPCGERGLKYPSRSAASPSAGCRSPCGERGLKSSQVQHMPAPAGRSPCGERGLK